MGNYVSYVWNYGPNIKDLDSYDKDQLLNFIKRQEQIGNLIIDDTLQIKLKNIELENSEILPMCIEFYEYLKRHCDRRLVEEEDNKKKKQRQFFIKPRFGMDKSDGLIVDRKQEIPAIDIYLYNIPKPSKKMIFNEITLDEFNNSFTNIVTKKDMMGISKKMIQNMPLYMKRRFINKFNDHLFLKMNAGNLAIGRASFIYKAAKKGPTNDIKSFRQIVSIPNIVNHFHRILTDRLDTFINENKLLDTSVQKGGISGQRFGIFEQFFKVKKVLKDCNKKGKAAAVLFLDVTNAFGNIDRSNMFRILREYSVDLNLVWYIESFYNNLEYYVKLNNQTSEFRKWKTGLVQGCPLSPLLFVLSLNFILKYLDSKHKAARGYDLGPVKMLFSAYMDDICIVAKDVQALSELYEEFSTLIAYLGLPISIDKSGLMVVNDDTPLPENLQGFAKIDKYKYLGEYIYKDGQTSESFSLFLKNLVGKMNSLERYADINGTDLRLPTFNQCVVPFIQRKMLIMYDLNDNQRLKIIGIIKESLNKWGVENTLQIFSNINKILNVSDDVVITKLDFNEDDVDNDLEKNVNVANFVMNSQKINISYNEVNKLSFDDLDIDELKDY